MKILEQVRMKKAYEFVKDVKDNHPDIEKDYGRLAKKLPAMIVSNGLITTMAFLRAKKSKSGGKNRINAHEKLLCQLLSYMKERRLGIDSDSYEDFRKQITDMEFEEYLLITQEVLAFAVWLKRIAEGEIKDEND